MHPLHFCKLPPFALQNAHLRTVFLVAEDEEGEDEKEEEGEGGEKEKVEKEGEEEGLEKGKGFEAGEEEGEGTGTRRGGLWMATEGVEEEEVDVL